tara:strand:+ start:1060 stop:1653 length:594 start_codon:yes stop_codon:yes gene_type:complete
MKGVINEINLWNISLGVGGESVLSNVFLTGCIVKTNDTFVIYTSQKNSDNVNSLSLPKDREESEVLAAGLTKIIEPLSNDLSLNTKLAVNLIVYSNTGGENGIASSDPDACFSNESDSAQFNEVFGDMFDEEQKLIVAWSWSYTFEQSLKKIDIINDEKVLNTIVTELIKRRNAWSTVLNEELKATCKYNAMVYFNI